ncbi:hypothetical protein AAFF_G00026240 [Aldrovandia affinis]|uniref:Uncharacterized protein n=1 Tax=Aldrovandia affinis TaxID=143900 RepID=A0AAD7S6V7_9TELE|nr:hypothetical protein AAFF_G00026240 [Aldrovandia affinis]
MLTRSSNQKTCTAVRVNEELMLWLGKPTGQEAESKPEQGRSQSEGSRPASGGVDQTRQIDARICRLVAPDIEGNPPGPCALPVTVKVTAALTFFATNSFQHTLEDALQDLRRREAELHVAIEGVGEAQPTREIRDRLAAELVP